MTDSPTEKIRTFRYCPHSQIEERLAEGWVIAGELGPPHCFYAVLIEWLDPEDAKLQEENADQQNRT